MREKCKNTGLVRSPIIQMQRDVTKRKVPDIKSKTPKQAFQTIVKLQ